MVTIIILSATLAGAIASCDSRYPYQSSSATKSAEPESGSATAADSPARIAERLNEYHLRRDYPRLARFVIRSRRDRTVSFLQAVDAVIDQHAKLHDAAACAWGDAMADAWSLAAMENNLGVFSADIRILNQRFKGDRAVVTLQEAGKVPLVRAAFQAGENGWEHVPDEVPPGLTDELWSLVEILARITESIENGAGYEFYVDSFGHHVLPQINQVVALGNEPR